MKSLIVSALLLGLAGTVPAQPAPAGAPSSIAAERLRIEQEHKREENRYAQEEAACYQRFAVTDCLREVRVRRRATFEDLQRQEISLNDAERKNRAAEQIKRAEEKSSLQSEQEDIDRRAAARQAYRERLERAEQKKAERQKDAEQKAGVPPKARSSAASPHDSESRAAEKKIFDDKQRQALERKAQRDKAQAEKSGQPAKPLPERP